MAALFVASPLAGCLQGEDTGAQGPEEGDKGGRPGPDVEGIGPGFLVLMNPLHATDCRNVEIVVPVAQDQAVKWLPEGFHPAPGPGPAMDAALVLEVQTCSASHTEEDEGGYSRAWASVLVEPPRLPEPAAMYEAENRTGPEEADERVDLYVVAAYVDGSGFKRFLRQSGILFEEAWFDLELEEVPGDARSAQVRVEEREDADEVLRLVGAGAASGASTQYRASWAVSRHGVQLFEEYQTTPDDGPVQRSVGSGVCIVGDEGFFAGVFDGRGCMPNEVRISGAFNVTGHSFWFRDTLVLG